MIYAIAKLNILDSVPWGNAGLRPGGQILRLGEAYYRFKLKRQSEAIQQFFNLQSSIFNSSSSGLAMKNTLILPSNIPEDQSGPG